MKLPPDTINLLYQDASNSGRERVALELARHGFHIHPLKSGHKNPILRDWENRATTDPAVIAGWFAKYRDCNYGIACGPSNIFVVDLDVKNEIDGIANWEAASKDLALEPSFEVITPSKGKHLYWRGTSVRNSAGTVAVAVDVRGTGGYVVGPESQTPEGKYSAGLENGLPDVESIQEAPRGLVELLSSRKGQEKLPETGVLTAPDIPVSTQPEPLGRGGRMAAFASEIVRVATALPGTRNDTLFKASAALGQIADGQDLTSKDFATALRRAARSAGLEEKEYEPTIQSGLREGQKTPRPVEAMNGTALFTPMDLKLWFETDHTPPEHFGRGGVLYREGLTWLSGEPESGKSFLALAWALDAVKKGESVIWLDEEAGPRDTLSKLTALGASSSDLDGRFLYLSPLGRDLSRTAGQFIALVKASDCRLVVLDSAAAVLANAGVDEDKNSQVTSLVNQAILPISKELGIATIVIDHKSKSNVKSRYSRGASAKLGIVDLALNVEATRPFSRGNSGTIRLTVMKDRWGDFGRDAQWDVDVLSTSDLVDLSFHSRVRAEPADERSRALTGYVDRVVQIVSDAYPGSLSKKDITSRLEGIGSEKSRIAIEEALSTGQIAYGTEKSGGKRRLTLPQDSPELF